MKPIAVTYLLALMTLSGFEYEFFTDLEQAIEWLSDIDEVIL